MLDNIPSGALWLPGQGMTSIAEIAAARAVEEYDKDLTLGQRQDTGEWVVFMKKGPTGDPFPVYGFGTRLPSVDEVKKKLYQADVRRHGAKIFKQIMAKQDAALAERRKSSEEANAELAEALVAGFRHQGYNPFPTIYRPFDKSKPKENN